jgi:hypothetical protein
MPTAPVVTAAVAGGVLTCRDIDGSSRVHARGSSTVMPAARSCWAPLLTSSTASAVLSATTCSRTSGVIRRSRGHAVIARPSAVRARPVCSGERGSERTGTGAVSAERRQVSRIQVGSRGPSCWCAATGSNSVGSTSRNTTSGVSSVELVAHSRSATRSRRWPDPNVSSGSPVSSANTSGCSAVTAGSLNRRVARTTASVSSSTRSSITSAPDGVCPSTTSARSTGGRAAASWVRQLRTGPSSTSVQRTQCSSSMVHTAGTTRPEYTQRATPDATSPRKRSSAPSVHSSSCAECRCATSCSRSAASGGAKAVAGTRHPVNPSAGGGCPDDGTGIPAAVGTNSSGRRRNATGDSASCRRAPHARGGAGSAAASATAHGCIPAAPAPG